MKKQKIFNVETMSTQYIALKSKIDGLSAKVAVVGLGYVGLPLAVAACDSGFDVSGYDVNANMVDKINNGISEIDDVSSEAVQQCLDDGIFHPTLNPEVISDSDVVLICVPTPLNSSKDPDLSYIMDAAEKVFENLHPGMLIILESTTYPGSTRDVFAKSIEAKGYKIGEDIFIAFSPERVDPGNKKWNTANTPKVVGGLSKRCAELAQTFYGKFLDKVLMVSSPEAAEMVKILENSFRAINIAFINEMAMISERLGLNIWEIIDAASTKPFGFMPFYPGPGIGGHCIPIDPHYLTWKLRSIDFYSKFIELASEVNIGMYDFVVNGVMKHLNTQGKSLNHAKVLVLGVAYKPDISDVRESPAIHVIEKLFEYGGEVTYNDPYINQIKINDEVLESQDLTVESIKTADIIVILTNHSDYDYEMIYDNAQAIYDSRNSFSETASLNGKIANLGVSKPNMLNLHKKV